MSYHGKRLPQLTFLSFPHHHKRLWYHEQLFAKHVAKSVMNPKTIMGAPLAVISKRAQANTEPHTSSTRKAKTGNSQV